MNFTLHQLQIFLKVAQTQSITKAAEELHLTQPAVSIQLKNFQEQFDLPLTEVVGRKLYITDFGYEIVQAGEKILNEVEAITLKTHAFKGQLIGKLKVSVVSTGKYVMPYFLTDFMSAHEGVELQMDVTNKSKVVESLERNEVDFALVSVLPKGIAIEHLDLLQNKLYVVAKGGHAFRAKKYGKEIFEKIDLIFREKGSGTRYVMERFIEANNLPVRKKMELATNEAVKQAVIAGLGCSIMPLIGLRNELVNGDMEIIPVKSFPIKSTWQLVWLKGKNFAPVAEAFLAHIKAERGNIRETFFKWYEAY